MEFYHDLFTYNFFNLKKNIKLGCPSTGDVVFVVDASRHVSRRELRDMRKFIKQLVRRMTFRKRGFRVGVVQFAGSAAVRLNLHQGSKKKAVMSSVSGIR